MWTTKARITLILSLRLISALLWDGLLCLGTGLILRHGRCSLKASWEVPALGPLLLQHAPLQSLYVGEEAPDRIVGECCSGNGNVIGLKSCFNDEFWGLEEFENKGWTSISPGRERFKSLGRVVFSKKNELMLQGFSSERPASKSIGKFKGNETSPKLSISNWSISKSPISQLSDGSWKNCWKLVLKITSNKI